MKKYHILVEIRKKRKEIAPGRLGDNIRFQESNWVPSGLATYKENHPTIVLSL